MVIYPKWENCPMSDIKLFRLASKRAVELRGSASDLEKPLQTLIEKNLETLLRIRFVASEHPTGKSHGGRIDTLGLDEDNCPVIIEYKRSTGQNVINQGLFYLNWLLDHQGDFQLLVQEQFGDVEIDWSAPMVVCIASDFTRYDNHAVQQMNRNIELIRYKRFDRGLLLLELVNSSGGSTKKAEKSGSKAKSKGREMIGGKDKTVAEWMDADTYPMKEVFDSLEGHVLSLGDDVQRRDLKLYVAFRRLRNFVTVEIRQKKLLLFLPLNPDGIAQTDGLKEGFTRDVRKIGHWGTGDLEVTIASQTDLEKAKPLILMAYEGL